MPGKSGTISVEVVFALPERQVLVALELGEAATVAEAIERSGLGQQFPDEAIDALPVGIWGHVTTPDHVLADGDRVEVYRPLEMDPREARRQLAQAGKTMRTARDA
ncbi:MAG TPA: RnfH family protein [Woeseiaceae bacterium]|jgi:putative ubiquitin-RnfH superfamily antitoxin RatB of RatAB toxin-antitoxin module|nr:RnfH family protein [Woeseiaceae bacterium]